VHVSDNNGKYDAHRGIGRGNIDWQSITEAFRRINYKGYLMLESTEHVEESLRKMRQILI
jgi:sugar phosphate isomerase/epimerase